MESPTFALIEKVIGRTCSRGGVSQVRVIFLDNRSPMIRNVIGPVKQGDVLVLLETDRDAKRIRWLIEVIKLYSNNQSTLLSKHMESNFFMSPTV